MKKLRPRTIPTKAPSLGWRILEHLKRFGRLTTLDARRMGIMHPGMRICELRKQDYRIDTESTYQADDTGAVHRVAAYVLRGDDFNQSDLFKG